MYMHDPLYVWVLWSCEDWLCVFVSGGRCLFVSLSVYFCARVCLNLVRLQLSVSCLCKTVMTDSVCCVSACPLFVSLSVCVSMNAYISSHARLKSPWYLFLLFLCHCLCLWGMGVCSSVCVSMFLARARAHLKTSYQVAADDKTFPYSLNARSQSETVKNWLQNKRTLKMGSKDPHRTFWASF